MVLCVSGNMVLLWCLSKRAASLVTALVVVLNLTMQALRWDMAPPAAEKPLAAPLRPAVAETSPASARTCCRVPSPAGDLCLLDFPSKGNRASRSGSGGVGVGVGAQIRLGNDAHPPELVAQGILHPAPDEFIKFMVTNHASLVAAMEGMKAGRRSDMEEIMSEMEKIVSELRRHAGEFRDLKDEVARQGTIQRLVICAVLVSAVALGFFVWANCDEWMKRVAAMVKVWAGEALYEFTGGWFGKKAS